MTDTRLNPPYYRQNERTSPPPGIAPGTPPPLFHEPAIQPGETTIETLVVAKIVDIAAREIDGVYDLTASNTAAGGVFDGRASGLASRMAGNEQRGPKANVMVNERATTIDIGMIASYGVNIPQVAEAVRRNVMAQVAAMTGLDVKQVNIDVTDLHFPQAPEQAQPQPGAQ
ncbi:MAG TPA: Asp23/Gls24 family envelope stress response protein [Ktedonobacterales bacterium]|nr:Asp23/Gls24 family envelope stress response protein [Ktedonobacterales bacterium]